MFNAILMETVENRFSDIGYSLVGMRQGTVDILYKKEDGVTKVIAIATPSKNIRSIADVKGIVFNLIVGTAANDVLAKNILYVIQSPSGTSHHFLGKNVVYVDHNGRFVTSCFVSFGMRKELAIIKNYRRLNKNYNKQDRILHPEDNRHSKLFLYALIAINIICFIRFCLGGNVGLGYSLDGVLAGDWTKMFTYMFAHANIAHLVGNMISLLFVGGIIMEVEGVFGFSAIYLLGGFSAAFIDCMLIAAGHGDADTITVGASGAIFALIGALLVECFFDRALEENRLSYIKYIVMALILSNLGKSINVKVHLAGFIVGFIFTLIYCFIKREVNYKRLYSLRDKEERYENRKKIAPVLSLKIEDDSDSHSSYDVLNRLQTKRTANYCR